MTANGRFDRALLSYLDSYHRHELHVTAPLPDRPSLVVANHGFGGIIDLNVLSLRKALVQLSQRPVTYLVHQLAWTTGIGRLLEPLGARAATRANAAEAIAAGHHVAVFPGGDLDAAKPWTRRNTIDFGDRSGFAALALQLDLPIVPVVTAGASESLLVLTDGQPLARMLRLPKLLRVKTLPVSLSVPWGLSVGLTGMLPYAALPTKLETTVLAPVMPTVGIDAPVLAEEVLQRMQCCLDELVTDRTPILGRRTS
jgi:1-acyl-sn-glycerol-3-phosphate acyltransferase